MPGVFAASMVERLDANWLCWGGGVVGRGDADWQGGAAHKPKPRGRRRRRSRVISNSSDIKLLAAELDVAT